MKKFFKTWKEILSQPANFFKTHAQEDWKKEPLTFFLISIWALAFAASLMIYMNKLWPIGVTLLEEINSWQQLLVAPVTLAVALVFFGIIFVIIGGVFVSLFYVLLFSLAFVFQFLLNRLNKKVERTVLLNLIFYSSAALLLGAGIFLGAILAQVLGLPLLVFRLIYNLIYYLVCGYLTWLWMTILAEEGKVSLKQAFLLSFGVVIFLILFQIVFDFKIFPKVSGWML